jgi:hypothetical protein
MDSVTGSIISLSKLPTPSCQHIILYQLSFLTVTPQVAEVLLLGADVVVLAVVAEGTESYSPQSVFVQHTNGRRSGRGGKGKGGAGAKGGKKVIVEPHRHKGVFVARGGKEDLLATANLVPGESVYGEKRISVETPGKDGAPATKIEYRVSSPLGGPDSAVDFQAAGHGRHTWN